VITVGSSKPIKALRRSIRIERTIESFTVLLYTVLYCDQLPDYFSANPQQDC
jgi:hypothetical protein